MSSLHREILRRVNFIEDNFDVNSLTYRKLAVWPLLRLVITRQLWQEQVPPGSYSRAVAWFKKMERRFPASGYIAPLVNLPFRLRELHRKRNAAAGIRRDDPAGEDERTGQVNALFLAKNNQRREEVAGAWYNSFFNSLPADASGLGSALMLEYSDNANYRLPRYGQSLIIDQAMAECAFRQALRSVGALVSGAYIREGIVNFTAFQQFIGRHSLPLVLTQFALIDRLERIRAYQAYFARLLEKHRPLLVFLTCFYDDLSFAAILAANEAGIKSVEMQHGQQGDYHLMYSNWSSMPGPGYELLPTHFWVWGAQSQRRIDAWAAPTARHRTILGGNPWLSIWAEDKVPTDPAEQEAREDLFKGPGSNVLIALQPVDDPLPDFVLRAMRAAPASYRWYVRLHPRMLNRRQEIHDRLNGIDAQFEMEQSSTMPLFALLKQMQFCLTKWSTVAYEADALGVEAVIIHPTGKELMREYCASGAFLYADDEEELLRCLASRDRPKPKYEPYLLADPERVRASLRHLIGS